MIYFQQVSKNSTNFVKCDLLQFKKLLCFCVHAVLVLNIIILFSLLILPLVSYFISNDIQSSNRAARLESQITAAALALEHEISEKQSMKNAIDLLNNELDENKRNHKKLQSEIKRLTCENDKMRKELSRYKGIRKYITGTHNHDDQNPKQPETAGVAPVNDTAVSEELSITKAKLASLRDHMIHIGNSLLSAVNDD